MDNYERLQEIGKGKLRLSAKEWVKVAMAQFTR